MRENSPAILATIVAAALCVALGSSAEDARDQQNAPQADAPATQGTALPPQTGEAPKPVVTISRLPQDCLRDVQLAYVIHDLR